MTGELVALALGTVLAIGALAFVLHPLFFDVPARQQEVSAPRLDGEGSAIRALREIEFDRATGKLSDPDYQSLRERYAEQALQEMRAEGTAPAAVPAAAASDDDVEARVRAYRAARRDCARCGLRPEPDAVYCSTCGDYLGGACPACSAPVSETSATFCSTCGASLAAPQPA
jgi:hypothetical protein